uniref:Uncharacterized protein n=1 Tax=Candidatus Kentrum sp. LPFa TaxID=2126335 RepID=A0A450Y796_9GAMM|nr:MAG: hypothetical protein BECKLPF1236A_GA0070988_108652 [Candidatus Kentron sp. LPFa]VFK37412.1 MAG: hypothetical protein BECKLPF1236C_GA0070990_108292 [Candidatus Kentron sp. LPFa]
MRLQGTRMAYSEFTIKTVMAAFDLDTLYPFGFITVLGALARPPLRWS